MRFSNDLGTGLLLTFLPSWDAGLQPRYCLSCSRMPLSLRPTVLALHHLQDLPPLPSNAQYVHHANECYDWGSFGWLLRERVDPLLYAYFLLVNSSVRGPYLPAWLPVRIWADISPCEGRRATCTWGPSSSGGPSSSCLPSLVACLHIA